MAKKWTPTCETFPLELGIENIFLSLIHQEPCRFTKAIECIANRVNRVPSEEVMWSLIFDVLMKKECGKEAAVAASLYLNDILTIYPPSDRNRRSFYKAALMGRKSYEFENLWSVFRYIVESCFLHYKLYRLENDESNVIPFPSCDILIDYYVRVLTESYDYFISESVKKKDGEENMQKEKSLVMELFWPTESMYLSAGKDNARQLLEWINIIYLHSARHSQIEAFKNLQNLLNLMVKCILFVDCGLDTELATDLPDSLICNSPCLLNIVKVVINTCKDAFKTSENFKRFLHHLSPRALQFKLCEYKLYDLIHSKQPSDRAFSSCTLYAIITSYMLTKGSAKKRRPKGKHKGNVFAKKEQVQGKKEKATTSSAPSSSTSNIRWNNVLHEYCKTNKPADLYLSLHAELPPDVNQKNCMGQTPLYVACLAQSFLCVKVLIEECTSDDAKQKINFRVTDDDGLTALHIAAKNNDTKTVKLILRKGGCKLLDAKDKSGLQPFHYSSSKEMMQALEEFLSEYESKKSEEVQPKTVAFTDLDIPSFQNFKESALFCHACHFLVTYYLDIYNLYHVRRLMMGESASLVEVLKHENKKCPHFTVCSENAVCSEDYECLKSLPDILNHFVKRINDDALKKELNLDVELLPAKMLIAKLDS